MQITCKLNNPHTVAIYDYGRTPEGVFYYAMEFLEGIDLQVLVEKYGPQPEGRVISILQQICGFQQEQPAQNITSADRLKRIYHAAFQCNCQRHRRLIGF